jgi:hypothetical protein
MAITFIQQNKRQKILVLVVLIVGAVAIVVLLLGFFGSVPKEAASSFSLPPTHETKIDFQVFDTPAFQELGAPAPPLQLPEKTKKANPFLHS